MGLHKPFDRPFIVLNGSVKKDGRSLQLADGQLGIFDITDTNVNGSKAVSSFKGKPKNTFFEIKLGNTDSPVTRSRSNKSWSSFPFKLSEVVDLKVSAPESTEQTVDEVIVGYNGIDDNTAITFGIGDRQKMVVRLFGEPIGFLGYENGVVDIPVYMDAKECAVYEKKCKDCDPCGQIDSLPIIMSAIDKLKNHQLRGGVKVSDFIDVTPIRKCKKSAKHTEIPYKFYCLEVCDTGDASALAVVQAQYDFKIERVGRVGSISKYQFIQPESEDAPEAFKQTFASVMKGCEDCPEDYTATKDGLLYVVTLEDEGKDKKSVVEGLDGAIGGTAKKQDGQDNGLGFYTVLLSKKLTSEKFDEFVKANPTSTIEYVGKVKAICENTGESAINWSECGTCNVIKREYILDLPDNNCGEDRLEELKSFYPNLEIELEGTEGGCQRRYKTKTISNLVCEECDDIFKDAYITKAPESFEGRQWKLKEDEGFGENCKMGIRLKGKVTEVHPTECFKDDLGFVDSSVQIQVSGGFLTEVRAGDEQVDKPFHVEYVSRASSRTHLGGNLWQFEDRARTFFTGEMRHYDRVSRMLLGEESRLDASKQYVDYALTLRRNYYSQGFGAREEDNVTYHVWVEVGRHQEVENLLNSLATSAGVSPVQAFGK